MFPPNSVFSDVIDSRRDAVRSEDKVDSLNFSLDRMPLRLCTFLRTMTCELEFNWEKSPINMLPLTLGNHQILREKSIYEIVSSSKEYLRHAGQAEKFAKVFLFLPVMPLPLGLLFGAILMVT